MKNVRKLKKNRKITFSACYDLILGDQLRTDGLEVKWAMSARLKSTERVEKTSIHTTGAQLLRHREISVIQKYPEVNLHP